MEYKFNVNEVYQNCKKPILKEIDDIIRKCVNKNKNKYYDIINVVEEDGSIKYSFNGFAIEKSHLSIDRESKNLELHVKVPFEIYVYDVGNEITVSFRIKNVRNYEEEYAKEFEEVIACHKVKKPTEEDLKIYEEVKIALEDNGYYSSSASNVGIYSDVEKWLHDDNIINEIQKSIANREKFYKENPDLKYIQEEENRNKAMTYTDTVVYSWDLTKSIAEFLESIANEMDTQYNFYKTAKYY